MSISYSHQRIAFLLANQNKSHKHVFLLPLFWLHAKIDLWTIDFFLIITNLQRKYVPAYFLKIPCQRNCWGEVDFFTNEQPYVSIVCISLWCSPLRMFFCSLLLCFRTFFVTREKKSSLSQHHLHIPTLKKKKQQTALVEKKIKARQSEEIEEDFK